MNALLAVLLLLQSPDERAKAIVQKIAFPAADDVKAWVSKGPEFKNVLDLVLKRETWTAAVKALEETMAPFGDDWTFEVKLVEWDGDHPAHGERTGKAAVVNFNMKKLGSYEKKMMEYRKQDEELRKKGKRLAWKVPPLKYDRLVIHELVHILQGEYASPGWFHEGLASWAGADLNYVQGFLYKTEQVPDVEANLEGDDVYGRGQMFMMWLEQKAGREAFKKLAKATILEGGEPKAAIAKLVGMEWAKLAAEELAWSRAYAKKHKPAKD